MCALMWAYRPGDGTTETQRITSALTAADFDDVAYGRLFTVLAELANAGRPHDPASVTDALIRSGARGAKTRHCVADSTVSLPPGPKRS
ncbi:DnaB-like helicase N-terminal domain-containing protein [Rhodococcoides fascians]|uniref:DnaB-like helicase N-terminal domain-containing protein n=1 Tax=Rhodococcoides fascians TaxID=1828 RepID=UPI00315AC81A